MSGWQHSFSRTIFRHRQEQIYQQALAKFQDSSYYDKLARLYLRERKREAFSDLTVRVIGIFSGTELDHFFANVNTGQPIGPQLALQLNLYAAKRFPTTSCSPTTCSTPIREQEPLTLPRTKLCCANSGGSLTTFAPNSSPISAAPENSSPSSPSSNP